MAKVLRTLARGANALNNSLYRASGGRLLGKLRGMPVLLQIPIAILMPNT